MPLCIEAGGHLVRLGIAAFTLAWTHTVEKIPWEEDWQVAGDRLVVVEARIKGSGAGMEPPPEARLEEGWYAWAPRNGTRREVILKRSPEVEADWSLCTGDTGCRALGAIVGEDAETVRLYPCD